jgi:DNA-binding CsgD family transcriptional regulator
LTSAVNRPNEKNVLTPSERRVLEKIAEGDSTGESAAALGLSVHTVRTHMRNIRRKLDAHSQAQAVATAYARGWIEPDLSRPHEDQS